MRLLRAVIVASGAVEAGRSPATVQQLVELPFGDEQGRTPGVSVIHGGPGTGKTTIVQAIACTRPGHAVPPWPRLEGSGGAGGPSASSCDWLLGSDDPERPHPLSVASPQARLLADEQMEALRRREQAHYEKLAAEGGFAFLAVTGTRHFARQPLLLSAPARTVARYDVRAPLTIDDPSRSDLAREVKQALAYAAISRALDGPGQRRVPWLGEAMSFAVDELARLAGFAYRGLDPRSFEPTFARGSGDAVLFDQLPTQARHLVAFAALAVRVLWAAAPEHDPRETEGVIAIDDVELHQSNPVLAELPGALARALPGAQWLLFSSSATLAASVPTKDLISLRRLETEPAPRVFCGEAALTH